LNKNESKEDGTQERGESSQKRHLVLPIQQNSLKASVNTPQTFILLLLVYIFSDGERMMKVYSNLLLIL